MEIEGKVALVTGAGSGIGRASALAPASAGAKLVVSDIDEQGGEETAELIRSAGARARLPWEIAGVSSVEVRHLAFEGAVNGRSGAETGQVEARRYPPASRRATRSSLREGFAVHGPPDIAPGAVRYSC